jgi:hypothetical protein
MMQLNSARFSQLPVRFQQPMPQQARQGVQVTAQAAKDLLETVPAFVAHSNHLVGSSEKATINAVKSQWKLNTDAYNKSGKEAVSLEQALIKTPGEKVQHQEQSMAGRVAQRVNQFIETLGAFGDNVTIKGFTPIERRIPQSMNTQERLVRQSDNYKQMQRIANMHSSPQFVQGGKKVDDRLQMEAETMDWKTHIPHTVRHSVQAAPGPELLNSFAGTLKEKTKHFQS